MSKLYSLVEGQSQMATAANANFAALDAAGTFGYRSSTTTGLVFGFYGGIIEVAGVQTVVANGTVTLTASNTNYIEANPATGVVTANTSGFTAGLIPMYVVDAATSTITTSTLVDYRVILDRPQLSQTLAKTWPSDANYTLTAAESRARYIRLSGATLTTTRDLLVPANWNGFVYNGTGGSQSVRVVESGSPQGSGVTIANGSGAFVYGDGTNIYRATADA